MLILSTENGYQRMQVSKTAIFVNSKRTLITESQGLERFNRALLF